MPLAPAIQPVSLHDPRRKEFGGVGAQARTRAVQATGKPSGLANRRNRPGRLKFSVFLTGSFGYGKKSQTDIEKRPHYRQTLEETIARRLISVPMRASGRGIGGCAKTWWGASGGVKNAIIVVSAARCLAAKGGSRYGRQTKSG
jgi:hypothetical protein